MQLFVSLGICSNILRKQDVLHSTERDAAVYGKRIVTSCVKKPDSSLDLLSQLFPLTWFCPSKERLKGLQGLAHVFLIVSLPALLIQNTKYQLL